MTLGCGGYGGNITSDNISPRHLLNIKRLAYEISPAANRFEGTATVPSSTGAPQGGAGAGISADALNRRIDEFLGSRGFREEAATSAARGARRNESPSARAPVDFVCEEDVRTALKAGIKLLVSERAIITPAARELGEQHRVFAAPDERLEGLPRD
jgi:hypothetical protein